MFEYQEINDYESFCKAVNKKPKKSYKLDKDFLTYCNMLSYSGERDIFVKNLQRKYKIESFLN